MEEKEILEYIFSHEIALFEKGTFLHETAGDDLYYLYDVLNRNLTEEEKLTIIEKREKEMIKERGFLDLEKLNTKFTFG